MKKMLFIFGLLFSLLPAQAQLLEAYEAYDIDTNTVYYTLKDSQTGITLAEGTFVDKKKSGTWYQYYPNGKLQFVQVYKEGIKSGTWKSWDSKGRMTAKLTYKGGRLISSTISRYY